MLGAGKRVFPSNVETISRKAHVVASESNRFQFSEFVSRINSTDCVWWFALFVQLVFTLGDRREHGGPNMELFLIQLISLVVRVQVSWVRRKEEQLHLITFGASTYISDSRYSLEFKQPNDWQLHIQYANERDEGQFECQINTSPPLVLILYLEVIGKNETLLKFLPPKARKSSSSLSFLSV